MESVNAISKASVGSEIKDELFVQGLILAVKDL